MTARKFVDIDRKRYLSRDILKLRQGQRRAAAKAEQPPLFELHDDFRPAPERTAGGRNSEPSLFSLLGHRGSHCALKQPQDREPPS
jgi:hypothetical protein